MADHGLVATCPMVRVSIALNSAQSITGLMTEGYTNIRLSFPTRDRLKKRGSKGEDYDHIIVRLLDSTEDLKK